MGAHTFKKVFSFFAVVKREETSVFILSIVYSCLLLNSFQCIFKLKKNSKLSSNIRTPNTREARVKRQNKNDSTDSRQSSVRVRDKCGNLPQTNVIET